MKLERTRERLERALSDGFDLRRVARDIGHELHNDQIDVLNEVRAMLSRAKNGDDFSQGYKSALADLVAAYTAGTRERDDLKAARQYLQEKKHARTVMTMLATAPSRPSEIALALGVNISTASRILASLRGTGLAEWSFAGQDGRSRYQQLSMFGEEALRDFPDSGELDDPETQKSTHPEKR